MRGLGDGEPRQIGRYRLLGRLGAGGMGDVYLARSDRGRTVAIKLVHEELAAQEEFRKRFRYEVEAARRVGGHWTAPVLDADTEAAVPWVATGYVAGPSLRQIVGRDHGPLPEYSVRTLAAGLAHALRDIHGAGIVHRDLKPSNVLVTIDGPRVIDFGIARALETVTDGHLTRTGALIGSPGFMAPEQVRSDRITPACDIFCLGSVLAYAATGKMPFGTAQTGAHVLMYRIAHEEPNLDGVPAGGMDLIRDCLEKNPAARPSLDEVLRRTGAQDTVADGHSHEPWLPGPLVAQLGRHAVSLLDTENPEPLAPAHPRGTPPVRAPAPETASVAEALSTPAAAPAPMPLPRLPEREPQRASPAADARNQNPFPQPPHSHKRRHTTMLIIALVVALSAGSVIYTLTGNDDHRDSGEPSDPATSPAANRSKGDPIPKEFVGSWTFNNGKDHNRRMNILEGNVGDTIIFLRYSGTREDGDTYVCYFKSSLESVRELEKSVSVSRAHPYSANDSTDDCSAEEAGRLILRSSTELNRMTGAGPSANWRKST